MPATPSLATVESLELTPSQLRLVIMRLARRLRQAAAADVTWSQLAALSSVERLGPVSLKDLADAENVTPPSMTRISTGLEERRLVARVHDPADRRVARLSMTDAGRRLLEATRSRRDAYLAERLAALDEGERDILAQALPLLRRLTEEPGL